MEEELKLRVHGTAEQLTVVYLPGIHGDWTLVGSFRRALAGRVRFVEMTYPRTLRWSLEDYAAEIERGLAAQGIHEGWILAESFGSQVAWPLVARKRFRAVGIILAGGFVRHPLEWGVRLAERLCASVSLPLLTRLLFAYARLARLRFRNSPEVLEAIEEFIARRTELDRQAIQHRLRLIAASDPRSLARTVRLPVYAMSGLFDPIVPWPWVRPWLKKNCPALREYRIIRYADHNVLGTGTTSAATLVAHWLALPAAADKPSATTQSV